MPDIFKDGFDPFEQDMDDDSVEIDEFGHITTRLPPLQIIQDEPDDELGEDPADWEGKVSRNAPCPCGSGEKYKHCHGALA
jgi:preprotein translocase subunit SecA